MPIATVEQIKDQIRAYMRPGRSMSLRILMSMVNSHFQSKNLLVPPASWDKAQKEILVLDPRGNRVQLRSEEE